MLRAVDRMLGQDPQCPQNHYLDVYNQPNLCGYGIWPGIEYNRGYHVNPCWGGLLDIFRLPKFTAEFMASQQDWQEAGVRLFIANWWTDISPENVTIYSNAERVRLFHNDVLVEERDPEPISVKHPPFVFRNVRALRGRERSVLCAQALVDGKVVGQVSCGTPGTPHRLKLWLDLQGHPLRCGGDIVTVHCCVLDREGNVVPWAADGHPILFSAAGAAQIVGDDAVGANPVTPKAGIASVLLRSSGTPGPIRITAQMYWPQRNERVAIQPDTLEVESI